MQRYFVELAYNGKDFHGWQIQPNAITVQEELNKKLTMLLRSDCYCVGCGRTDTGVHAKHFIAHFETDVEFDLEIIKYKLNQVLPPSIAVYDIFKVQKDAHSRFSALSRSYKYTITRQKNPFYHETAWMFNVPLNLQNMTDAAALLFDYEDFTSFSKLHTDTKTNNCNVYEAEWEEKGHLLVFSVSADRFLRNMVRAIVGTLVEVGKGKISVDEFAQIIEAKDRSKAGFSAPAHGLALVNVSYPEWIHPYHDSDGF